jgi:hypothetical protein
MKYWLFQNNQVVGPFDREDLSRTPGFSSESLVCPEGRKGTQMGDWQRAGIVADLSETLVKLSKVPASVGAADSFLPPEPALRDLAVLGSLQEKVSALEGACARLEEELREKVQEIAQVRKEFEARLQEPQGQNARLDALEGRLSELESLRGEIASAQGKGLEFSQAQSAQALAIEDLKRSLETARDELGRAIEESGKRQKEALLEASAKWSAAPPPAPEPAAAPEPEPFSIPEPSAAPGLEEPGPAAQRPGEAPAFQESPQPGISFPEQSPPPPDFLSPPAPAPGEDASLSLSAPPAPQPAAYSPGPGEEIPNTVIERPLDLPTPGESAFSPLESLSDQPQAGAGPSAEPDGLVEFSAHPRKKSSAGKALAFLALLAAAAGAGAAYYLGYFDPFLKKNDAAQAPGAELPDQGNPPLPSETTQKGLPDGAQTAIDVAKSQVPAGAQKSLAELLEGPNPPPGLSPWTVERVEGMIFNVHFFDRSSNDKNPKYNFEVKLGDRTVKALDPSSEALLSGSAAPPNKAAEPSAAAAKAPAKAPAKGASEGPKAAKGKKARKPASKAEEGADTPQDLGSQLGESPLAGEEPPAPVKKRGKARPAKPRPSAKKSAAEEAPAEEEPAPEEEGPAPAPRKGKKAASAKPKKEMSLDELLLPGNPRQP